MVVDEVVFLASLVAGLGLGDDLDGDVVLGVVEVNDVHVKDQHGRAGDVLTCRNHPHKHRRHRYMEPQQRDIQPKCYCENT